MAIVRCANGHFYDHDKYKECPYCIKRESERSEIQRNMQNVPQFEVKFDTSINEAVTIAKPKDGDVQLGVGIRSTAAGISAGKDPVTIGIFSKHQGKGYVTGWLVAREGPVKGRDYRIYHGMNWIGRNPNMDICISEDLSISQNKHCAVVYDGKSTQFFVVKGNGSLTYVNGELLEDSVPIHLGDTISIGSCQFEFVPFCREGHKWES